jgi:hypothetical protein
VKDEMDDIFWVALTGAALGAFDLFRGFRRGYVWIPVHDRWYRADRYLQPVSFWSYIGSVTTVTVLGLLTMAWKGFAALS